MLGLANIKFVIIFPGLSIHRCSNIFKSWHPRLEKSYMFQTFIGIHKIENLLKVPTNAKNVNNGIYNEFVDINEA